MALPWKRIRDQKELYARSAHTINEAPHVRCLQRTSPPRVLLCLFLKLGVWSLGFARSPSNTALVPLHRIRGGFSNRDSEDNTSNSPPIAACYWFRVWTHRIVAPNPLRGRAPPGHRAWAYNPRAPVAAPARRIPATPHATPFHPCPASIESEMVHPNNAGD